MVILGIDPVIGRMGYGVIKIQDSRIMIQDFGCVETDAKSKIEMRLFQIHQELNKIMKEYKPDVLAIEELFFGANAKTALIVGQARGVVLLLAGQHNISLAVYTPLQVKIALTGYGRAEKAQIGQMVKVLLKLPNIPKPDDTADALAVALTHAFSQKYGILTSKKR